MQVIFLSYIPVKLFCLVFFHSLLHIQDFNLYRFTPELNLNAVAAFNIQRSFGSLSVYKNTAGITGFVGHCAALNQPGYL